MSSTTWVTILTVAAGPIAAVVGFLGVRLSQRQSNKQLQITAEIQRDQVNASAYDSARQVWTALTKDLQTERDSLKRSVSDLSVKVDAQDMQVEQWRRRLEDLEQKRQGDRRAIHLISDYARRLLRVIEDNNLSPPQPPEGLDATS
jgi:septal ring factor EnvC (AmiA/AmiB activator)